jgi:DNA polymerase-3 subunit beta
VKFSCTRENLHQGLSITSRVGGKNVNLPILSNVLVRADGGGIKLISTNLEIAISCSIRGKVDQDGEYTVPAKLFFDYVNLLPNERVDVDLLDNAIFVGCGNAKTKIHGIPATEFPLIPPVGGGTVYSIGVANFSQALSQVLFAAATNESRPELSGILLNFDEQGKLIFAATDSYRLSEVELKLPVPQANKVIVPQRTLSELNRILSIFRDDVEAPSAVEIRLSDNQIVFQYGSVELTSRVIEGSYPDYKQIIPTQVKTEVLLDCAEFQQAVKTVSLFSKTGLFDVTLGFDATNQQMEVSASDKTRGENTVILKAAIQGVENRVVLNFRYLLDGLNAISSSQITFKMIDGMNPCLLLPKEMPNESFQYIIMPIRQ